MRRLEPAGRLTCRLHGLIYCSAAAEADAMRICCARRCGGGRRLAKLRDVNQSSSKGARLSRTDARHRERCLKMSHAARRTQIIIKLNYKSWWRTRDLYPTQEPKRKENEGVYRGRVRTTRDATLQDGRYTTQTLLIARVLHN